MELKEKIRSITYRPGEHATYARVELHSGFVFDCESPYVSLINNAFGEKYCKERAIAMLEQFEKYKQAEEQFQGQSQKEAW